MCFEVFLLGIRPAMVIVIEHEGRCTLDSEVMEVTMAEDRGKQLQDIHNQAEKDHSSGKYDPPPGSGILDFTEYLREKHDEEREAYISGWANADKNK